MSRPIYEIAQDIRKNWSKVSPYAKPYLDAMSFLETLDDNYYFDSGESVVLYFLANAHSFRGDAAKKLKQELKDMVKEYNKTRN